MSQASLARYADRCGDEAETASFLARSLEPAACARAQAVRIFTSRTPHIDNVCMFAIC